MHNLMKLKNYYYKTKEGHNTYEKKSYIEKNPESIKSFIRAIQKGLDYVNTHSSADIAKVIAPQFNDTDLDTITTIVERYKAQDSWKKDTIFDEDSFFLLTDILKEAGQIDTDVPYEKLVITP